MEATGGGNTLEGEGVEGIEGADGGELHGATLGRIGINIIEMAEIRAIFYVAEHRYRVGIGEAATGWPARGDGIKATGKAFTRCFRLRGRGKHHEAGQGRNGKMTEQLAHAASLGTARQMHRSLTVSGGKCSSSRGHTQDRDHWISGADAAALLRR